MSPSPSGQIVTVEIQGQADIDAGERIGLDFADDAYHLFDANERVIHRQQRRRPPRTAAASTGS